MKISLIVAAAENDVIGNKNALPWHLPSDLKHFRALTKGHPVLMGRRTYESIGKPLPDRRNIVISTTKKNIEGCEVFSSLGEALEQLLVEGEKGEIFVIGGVRVFEEALLEIMSDLRPHRIYLTRVHADIDGDVKLPTINWKHWNKVSSEFHEKDKEHAYAYTFEMYERKEV
jgi:dihydrofolate reductase